MLSPLSILSALPKEAWKYIAIIVSVIIIVAALYQKGKQYGKSEKEKEWLNYRVEMEKKLREAEGRSAEKTIETVIEYVEKIQIVKEQGRTIYEKIPIYITSEDNSSCVIPDGFVMLLNSAATRNELPEIPKSTTNLNEETSAS